MWSVEVYNPSAEWGLSTTVPAFICLPTTPALLTNGDVLISCAAQFYNPRTATWTATGALPATISSAALEATLPDNGNVLGTGGYCKNKKGYYCDRAPEGADYLTASPETRRLRVGPSTMTRSSKSRSRAR